MSDAETAARPAELPELSVQSFAACEVQRGFRLQGAAVDADTIYLVLAGTMHMRLPNTKLSARAGSMVFVPPRLQPGIAPTPGPAVDIAATRSCLIQRTGALVFDAAHGGRGDLRVVVGRVSGGLSESLGALGLLAGNQPLSADLSSIPLARSAFHTLLDELDNPSIGLAALSSSLMKTCLLLFIHAVRQIEPGQETRPAPAGNRLAGVVAAIRARPSDKHSLATLAAAAGMSRATFARRFVEATGTSPMDFVLQARLQEAAAMLRATDLPVKQIAAQSGFQSRSHFTRAFITAFGNNPTSFRADLRELRDPPIMAE